jgi:hypothetical protein
VPLFVSLALGASGFAAGAASVLSFFVSVVFPSVAVSFFGSSLPPEDFFE